MFHLLSYHVCAMFMPCFIYRFIMFTSCFILCFIMFRLCLSHVSSIVPLCSCCASARGALFWRADLIRARFIHFAMFKACFIYCFIMFMLCVCHVSSIVLSCLAHVSSYVTLCLRYVYPMFHLLCYYVPAMRVRAVRCCNVWNLCSLRGVAF